MVSLQKGFCLTALAGLLLTIAANSQTVYTNVSGYVKHELAVGFNLISVNVHNSSLVSGAIETEITTGSGPTEVTTITDSDASFDTKLNDPLATYQIEITSGPQLGAVAEITNITATTIELSGAGLGAGIGAEYTIRAAETLDNLFGTSLTGNITDTGADTVWIQKPDGNYDRYFYSTLGNEFRSTADPFTDVTVPISIFYPEAMFVQIVSQAATATFFGDVKVTPTVVSANNGFNLVRVSSPAGQTLDESNLSDFLTPGATDTGADTVWIQDGSGGYNRYFVSSIFTGEWRETSAPFGANAGSTVLPSAVLIQRVGGDTAGVFDLPDYFDDL